MLGARVGTRRPGRTAAALAAVAALLVTAGACGASGPKNKDGLGTARAIAAADRKPFPMLSGTTLDGTRLTLASFHGRVVVVNLWASWCGPCQAEAPYLEHAYEAYQAKGVQFVGLDAHDNGGQAKAFVRDNKITYPNLFDDADETLVSKLAGITSLSGVPTTLIIDREGRLAWRALNPVDYTELSAALDPVIAE